MSDANNNYYLPPEDAPLNRVLTIGRTGPPPGELTPSDPRDMPTGDFDPRFDVDKRALRGAADNDACGEIEVAAVGVGAPPTTEAEARAACGGAWIDFALLKQTRGHMTKVCRCVLYKPCPLCFVVPAPAWCYTYHHTHHAQFTHHAHHAHAMHTPCTQLKEGPFSTSYAATLSTTLHDHAPANGTPTGTPPPQGPPLKFKGALIKGVPPVGQCVYVN